MVASFAKKTLVGATTVLLIGLAVWGADFRLALDGNDSTSMAILADDWAIYGELIWGDARSAGTQTREIFLESWEARPLRAIEYGALAASYEMAGLHGGFWLQLIILSLTGALFASLLRRRFCWQLALAGGLLVVLHPADTTHGWLATMMAKLACVYALLALHLFVRRRYKSAAVLLLASFLSYELAPLIFALAPFFADGGQSKSVKHGLLVFAASLSIYLGWRFFIFIEAAPDVRRLAGAGTPFDLETYGRTFGTAICDMLFSTTFLTELRPQVAGIVTALVLGGVVAAVGSGSRMDESPQQSWLRGLGWGLAGICAGASLSFRAAPNAELGIASRHNIAAVFGAALFFVALAQGLQKVGSVRAGRFLALFFCTALLALFAQERQAIQTSYLDAGSYQRKHLKEALQAIGSVKPHTLIVLEHPLDNWQRTPNVMPPFITGQAYEIEAICELVYDKSVVGLCMQSPTDDAGARTTTAHAIFAEDNTFHEIVHYDFETKKVTWVRRSEAGDDEKRIAPGGPAWRYCLGT